MNRNGEVQHQGTLNKALKRIARDCNDKVLLEQDIEDNPVLLPNFSCHILRHTFATRLCEAGVNLKVIQDIRRSCCLDQYERSGKKTRNTVWNDDWKWRR